MVAVKLLGSRLGSAEDIDARIIAANRAFSSVSWKRHTQQSRLSMFNCLILPVLLYNGALWTLTKALESKIDVWHRRKLRYILGIIFPNKISNNALYAKTAQCPISAVCRRRRLLWFGHVIREGKDAVSYKALHMAMNITDIKKPRGRPVTRWVDNIRNDLLLLNMSLLEAEQLASDRTHWLDVVDRCMTLI